MKNEHFESYAEAVERGEYRPLTDHEWETIQYEGLDDEAGVTERERWTCLVLDIPAWESAELKAMKSDTIERWNEFDISLKDAYKGEYVDFIDYEVGKVRIIRVPKKTETIR